MQTVPLRSITPNETKEFTLDLVKNTNPNDPQNQKWRGQLVVELTFNLFRDDSKRFSVSFDNHVRNESDVGVSTEFASLGAGLLLVTVQRAEDVEGKHHSNPYALIIFRGEQKKTKVYIFLYEICKQEIRGDLQSPLSQSISSTQLLRAFVQIIRKSRDPCWNEEFQFVLEEAPLKEKIHIEVKSKRSGLRLRPKVGINSFGLLSGLGLLVFVLKLHSLKFSDILGVIGICGYKSGRCSL